MRWPIALVLAGCNFTAPPPATSDTPPPHIDAPATADAEVDAPDNQLCLGANNFRICVPPPTDPFTVVGTANTGIDTDSTPNPCNFVAQPNGPTLCVIAATTITIDANILFVSGQHPLVLFASDTIEISNGVDVGSHFAGQALGAGYDSASCIAASNAGSGGSGGGGGAGGSFGTHGGNGGSGGGGVGSQAGGTLTNDFLRGGCKGSDGGNGAASTGGGGNHGGGAVMLLAGASITITGFVNASGGGGEPGKSSKGGGGGGGSGGMIVMGAPNINLSGQLTANGGGGGGGASGGQPGQPGKDSNPTAPMTTANGGTGGGGSATDGAAGAAGSTVAGNSPNAGDGAGGGGGGLGDILILSGQTVGGATSPVPRIN
jgi:hypothetical protein